ncbi:hypothetical protein C1T31_05690 [Hanstruepera neustonica]|uniref:DUF4157 domain-containing protein n=1 Tax=Hanstruepera neustonica TaxID=1445657 RepID=A0A2K1E0L4_9FLAO|nr:hypothetical protein C1T31_05690 [Hanstruepera neustonica]
MILISKYLVPRGYIGISLFPFIILKYHTNKQDRVLINHERIHLRQQLELLIVLFYVWYVIEFLIRFFHCKNWRLAYLNISFEREAYQHEKDLDYLKSRSFWAFKKYL